MKYLTLVLTIALAHLPAQSGCIAAGKWRLERADGSYGIMEISSGVRKKNIRLYLSSGGEIPNQSEISFSTKGDHCEFKYVDRQTECEIVFKKRRSEILVNTIDRKTFSCGFPAAVIADGLYEPMKKQHPARDS